MGDPPPPPQPPPKPKGLVDLLQEGAGTVMGGLGGGLDKAGAALATPENAEIAALLPATDLPELAADGPLGMLAKRLDREADLFRAVALRELARSGWVERIAQTVVVIAAACMAAVAATALTLAVFGGTGEGRTSLLLLAAFVVGLGGVGAAVSASRMRASHSKLAEEALNRARAVEDRLFRVGIAMEWRAAGATLYQDALARLERDMTAPREEAARAD